VFLFIDTQENGVWAVSRHNPPPFPEMEYATKWIVLQLIYVIVFMVICTKAVYWLGRIAKRQPELFPHWQIGVRPTAG
jgi:hypothetical protein